MLIIIYRGSEATVHALWSDFITCVIVHWTYHSEDHDQAARTWSTADEARIITIVPDTTVMITSAMVSARVRFLWERLETASQYFFCSGTPECPTPFPQFHVYSRTGPFYSTVNTRFRFIAEYTECRFVITTAALATCFANSLVLIAYLNYSTVHFVLICFSGTALGCVHYTRTSTARSYQLVWIIGYSLLHARLETQVFRANVPGMPRCLRRRSSLALSHVGF